MRDIRDAIDYAVREENADPDHVFLIGESGGGHMALMMAGYCPAYFEAIAASVPITDLKKWEEDREPYRRHVLACCSNDEAEMAKRSPMSYIDRIATANIKIFHGKYDESVPFTHSLELFNATVAQNPRARVFLEIFDGGHQALLHRAEEWFTSQYRTAEAVSVSG